LFQTKQKSDLKVSGREENYLLLLGFKIPPIKNESILTLNKTPFQINMVEIPEETFLKKHFVTNYLGSRQAIKSF
jgi:hypothetical protein